MSEPHLRVCLRGIVQVALPPERALQLFTPSGERAWAPGWDPHFPSGEEDDTAPGTVFVTRAHGVYTVWVVTERAADRMAYSRVAPETWGGTVSILCRQAIDGTEIEVAYDTTSLSEAGDIELRQWAASFDDYLQQWQSWIGEMVGAGPGDESARRTGGSHNAAAG